MVSFCFSIVHAASGDKAAPVAIADDSFRNARFSINHPLKV
jgi:hypothetical protein